MSDLGYPVVGDKLYGKEDGIAFRHQALHAERLEFTHPITNKKMKIGAPLPADMKKLIDRLRGID
jgi:23S rRNA pseudouridine1911/1915/1917 synthase